MLLHLIKKRLLNIDVAEIFGHSQDMTVNEINYMLVGYVVEKITLLKSGLIISAYHRKIVFKHSPLHIVLLKPSKNNDSSMFEDYTNLKKPLEIMCRELNVAQENSNQHVFHVLSSYKSIWCQNSDHYE